MAIGGEVKRGGGRDTTEAVVENAKTIAAAPRRADYKAALGKRRQRYVKEAPDGRWEITVPRDDARAVQEIRHLADDTRKMQLERSQKAAGEYGCETTRVRTKDGRTVVVRAENERWLHRKTGALPAPQYGGLRVVSGPDGMLWRSVAGYWVPTGRTCLGTPLEGDGVATGPQRDPDGNMWELNPIAGEWEIVLYVEAADG